MATNSTYLKVILSAVDKISPAFKKINRLSKLTSKSLSDIGRAGGQIAKSLTVASIGALTAAVGGLWKVLTVNRQFEKFATILETVEGSSEKARKSMAWVEDFAIKTPFELAEVTDAFVKLKAYGIDPTNGSLKSAGDAASAMGKTVNDAVEALADAMTGENERLKEFGIKAKKQGDRITYAWNQNGKQMTKVANANNAAQIEAVITGIWNSRYAGAMDKLAKTYDGLWSNVLDVTAKFMKKIGDKGLFSALKNQLQGVLNLLDKWEKDGTLDKIATEISRALTDMVTMISNALRNVDWVATIKSIRSTAAALKSVVNSLGGLKGIAIGLGVALAAGPIASIMSIVGALFRFGSGALAILGGPVLLAIAAIAAGAYLIFKNWDKVTPIFNKLGGVLGGVFGELWAEFKKLYDILAPVLMPVLEIFGKILLAGVVGAVYALGKALQVLVGAITRVIKPFTTMLSLGKRIGGVVGEFFGGAGNINVNPTQRTNILGASNQKLNGDINVKFENAPPGMRVAEGKTNQTGVKINPDVGYRFNGYAL